MYCATFYRLVAIACDSSLFYLLIEQSMTNPKLVSILSLA